MAFLEIVAENKVVLLIIGLSLILLIPLLIFIEKRIIQRKKESAEVSEVDAEEEIEALLHEKEMGAPTISKISDIAKRFFEKKYGINREKEYDEIISNLMEKNRPRAALFARKMVEYIYAGEKLDQTKTTMLLMSLRKIVQEEKELERDAAEKLEKKKSFFRNFPLLQKILFSQKKPAEQSKKEELEEQESFIFEEVRNLKPLVIKPEIINVRYNGKTGKKSQHFVTEVLDNLDRIRVHLKNTAGLI